jgi:uncharacterized protein YrrD
MIIEATHIIGLPVKSSAEVQLGSVDLCVFDGRQAKLIGFQVRHGGVVKKFSGLPIDAVLSLSREAIIVDSSNSLLKDLKQYDEAYKAYGPILQVTAKTESGKKIGKVTDLTLEAETGYITRFYLHNLLQERIIPRDYLVSISPKEIIFKDVVSQPIFDQVAATEASPAM